jgi:hypothetical protein
MLLILLSIFFFRVLVIFSRIILFLLILTDGFLANSRRNYQSFFSLAFNHYRRSWSADFREMDKLDADDAPLYSRSLGIYMDRDVVLFVQFNQFKNNPTLLAKETLQEIPKQAC